MAIDIRFTYDASGPIEMLEVLLPAKITPLLKRGAARAAARLQAMMREELDRMIYLTPESPNYKRTHTLYRSCYATRPGAIHSADHDAAKAGVDLGAPLTGGLSPGSSGGGFVKISGFTASVEIGAFANYAMAVHEGWGNGPRIPKPFTRRPAAAADAILAEELQNAIAEMFSGAL